MAAERCGAELFGDTAVQVCMTCLDTDSQMFSMSEYELQEAYEHLTGYPLFDVGNLNHTLCIQCAQRLRNFVQFRDKSLRARALMMDFVKQHKVITPRHVAALRPLQAALELERGADAQISVKTEPGLDRAWDSADTLASAKMETDMVIAWDSADTVSVKIEPDVIIEFDGADVQASGSAHAEASVKTEPDLDTAWNRLDAEAPTKTAEPRTGTVISACQEFSREREDGEHARTRHRTARASRGCSASVGLAPSDDNDENEQNDTNEKCEQMFDIDEEHNTCKLCLYKCKYKSDLVRHMRTHTGERPFACELCEYKCSRNSHLVRHMRTHTGEKPFTCKLCQYKFSHNSSLVQHMRSHTGEKPFACELCDYKCSRNNSLVSHMRTHTGEKRYSCQFCDFKCSVKRVLVKHIQSTHPTE